MIGQFPIASELEKLKPIPLEPLPDSPLVSILMPNYNYGRYIGEAIESVLRQTYPHWELIICDDGSTDNSCEVVKRYQDKDSRIKLIQKENGGMASALNVAYRESKGDIICLLDSDDIFLPDKIEKIISAFLQDKTAGMCVHKVLPVDSCTRPITGPLPKTIDHGWLGPIALRNGGRCNLPPTSGISLRREVAELIFPIPLIFRRVADGYVRSCVPMVTQVVALPNVLALYRLHGDNITGVLKVSTVSIEKVIEDYTLIADATRDFLRSFYGFEVANVLNIEDFPGYWEHLIVLYILKGESKKYFIRDILKKLPHGTRKVLWVVLCYLPVRIAQKILELWWGNSRLKRIYKKLDLRQNTTLSQKFLSFSFNPGISKYKQIELS